jgi:hypothetical protein
MPVLKELCTLKATLGQPIDVGATPSGQRQIFDVSGGEVSGSRVSGRVLPSGGDWILVGADGVGRLDVRAAVETGDGARIYVQYPGVMVLNEAVIAAIGGGGGETNFGDTYFMTTPRFETGHPDYAWLNSIVTVGQGRLLPGAVEYRIFEVCND